MLLIWLHGIMIEGSSPAKGLYEALLSVGIPKIAGRIYFHNFICLLSLFMDILRDVLLIQKVIWLCNFL